MLQQAGLDYAKLLYSQLTTPLQKSGMGERLRSSSHRKAFFAECEVAVLGRRGRQSLDRRL